MKNKYGPSHLDLNGKLAGWSDERAKQSIVSRIVFQGRR